MSPWSPSNPGTEPGSGSGSGSAPDPAPPATGFLPRLDYYLKLAEGPVLPDEASPDAEGSVDGQSGPDTPMVDPELQPALDQGIPQDASSEVSDRADLNAHGRLVLPPKGSKAFYGPTNLLNLYPPNSSSWGSAEKPTPVPRESLLPLGQEMLEQQLTDEYFLYDNFFIPRFTKQLYLLEKSKHDNGGDSELYSPALGHAILAVGALYADETDNSDVIEMSDRHAARARTLLGHELRSPRISAVLTLMALCSISAANGHDSQGWLDSGTALRLIPELGLDQQMHFSPPLDALSPTDVAEGVLALDTAWRNWTGRLPDDDGTTYTKEKPKEHSTGNKSWYTNLMLIQRYVLHHIKHPPNDFADYRRELALLGWDNEAKIRHESETPMMIQARMHRHSITMQLHEFAALPEQCLWNNTASSPCERCLQSAGSIDSLRQEFRERFGLRKLNPLSIHPLLSAGLTEVFSCHGAGQSAGRTRQQKQAVWRSMQAFVEVAERMSVGQMAMEVIMTAQREGPPGQRG